MPFDSQFTRATFIAQTGPDKGKAVEVHFNPVSLQFSINNTLSRTGSGDSNKQHVSQASAKLTMQLSEKLKLDVSQNYTRKWQPYRGADQFKPLEATESQDFWAMFGSAKGTYIARPNLVMDLAINRSGYGGKQVRGQWPSAASIRRRPRPAGRTSCRIAAPRAGSGTEA